MSSCWYIINTFEASEFKEKAFNKFSTKAKLVYADTLFQYYNLIKFNEPRFSPDKIDKLILAKSYLWKIYLHNLDGRCILDKEDLGHCLTTLSGCLGELSRWFEPLYLLNEAKIYQPDNPNIEYSRALILVAMKTNTCLSFNGILMVKIIDSCREACKILHILKEQKIQLKIIEKESREFLNKNKQSITKLRKHKTRVANNI